MLSSKKKEVKMYLKKLKPAYGKKATKYSKQVPIYLFILNVLILSAIVCFLINLNLM